MVDIAHPEASSSVGAGTATHCVPSHANPAAHWSVAVQPLKQLPVDVSQRYGAHGFGVPSRETEVVRSSEHVDVFGSHLFALHT